MGASSAPPRDHEDLPICQDETNAGTDISALTNFFSPQQLAVHHRFIWEASSCPFLRADINLIGAYRYGNCMKHGRACFEEEVDLGLQQTRYLQHLSNANPEAKFVCEKHMSSGSYPCSANHHLDCPRNAPSMQATPIVHLRLLPLPSLPVISTVIEGPTSGSW